MRRRAALLLALGACGSPEPPVPAAEGPAHVIVLSIDTLRRDSLRVYDDDAAEQPHLDRLAAESVCFERAHSTASWTLPSHASLVSGLYPDRHGATSPRLKIPAEVTCLAEVLGEAGYQTVAFTDGGYVHRRYGFQQGFERYDGWTPDRAPAPEGLPRKGRPPKVPGSALFDRALAFLNTRQDSRPLFLFLHSFSVHDYFQVHPWSAAQVREPLAGSGHYLGCVIGTRQGDADDWQRMRELYTAELRHLDQAFGLLRAALQPLEPYWLILTADHGEGFEPERQRIHHGGRLHEDVIRIPLLVRGPGLRPRRVATPASLVDVMPTVLELLRLPAVAELDGVSLASAMRGEDLGPRPLFAMEHHHFWQGGRRRSVSTDRARPLTLAVMREEWWWIRPQGEDGALFHMDDDPGQHQPRAAPEVAAQLREASSARQDYRPRTEARGEDAELDQQLRDLGYVEDDDEK